MASIHVRGIDLGPSSFHAVARDNTDPPSVIAAIIATTITTIIATTITTPITTTIATRRSTMPFYGQASAGKTAR